ncbi:hypothetical protein VNO77_30746 [Canavalia gladiata]|uniref:Uncharacterized protein n=1 Tax=Canavalia gladiata TaxID=3824 RepID=A0AAN9KNQ2_CANGL
MVSMAQIRDATQLLSTRVLQPRGTQQKQNLRKATSVMPRKLTYDSDPSLSLSIISFHQLAPPLPHLLHNRITSPNIDVPRTPPFNLSRPRLSHKNPTHWSLNIHLLPSSYPSFKINATDSTPLRSRNQTL